MQVQRLAYLTWLSEGKRDGSVPVGYAFLYFYGLERRLLVDGPAPDEEAVLVAEVERLRLLYSEDYSFQSYSRRLLEVVELRKASARENGLADWSPDPHSLRRGSEMPFPLQYKLAIHAARGVPVGAQDAVAAMIVMPPYQGGPTATIGMSRSRTEFVELAMQRFRDRFPGGYVLRDDKASTLSTAYHAAAQHLDVELHIQGIKRLPDPAALAWTEVADLCAQAAEDLAPYAKLIGKDRSRSDSVAAALALPRELAGLGAAEPFSRWLKSLRAPIAQVALQSLGRWCFGEGKEATGQKQAREMSAMLAGFGYGMEPDPAHGGERPGADVLVFRNGPNPLPPAFQTAALAVTFVAAAEPGPDPGRFVSELASRLQFDMHAAVRLQARFLAQQGRPAPPGKLKILVSGLTPQERHDLVELTASAVAACGNPSKATISVLERLFAVCGVDRRTVYAVLHQGVAAPEPGASEPVVVEAWSTAGTAFRIPQPSAPPETHLVHGAGLVIDMAKVNAIVRETQEVAKILAPIYQDEDRIAPVARKPDVSAQPRTADPRYAGLKADYAGLIAELCGQESWPRLEFEARARARGLMPDGAVETINEWAFDTFDEALLEDGDTLTINVALLSGAPESMA